MPNVRNVQVALKNAEEKLLKYDQNFQNTYLEPVNRVMLAMQYQKGGPDVQKQMRSDPDIKDLLIQFGIIQE